MTTSSKILLYASITSIILIYISGIFSISQFIKFIKCKNTNFRHPFWEARHSKLDLLYIASFLFVLYILNPLTLILVNFDIDQSIPLFINDTGNNFVFLAFFTRSWVFCFDRYFIDTLRNWIWRREVNPRESKTNKLIKYRDILSTNRRLIITMFYIICICPIFIILLMLADLNIIHHIVYRIIYTITLIILLSITYYLIRTKMSIVTDEHGVRQEALYCIKSSGTFFVTSHIMYLLLFTINSQIAMFIEMLTLFIANLCIIYFSCYWTRNKFISEAISKLHRSNHHRRRSFLNIFAQKQHISFDDIMNHRAGIEAFGNHLSNEFGLESILFIIEVCQYKAKINEKYNHFTKNIDNASLSENGIFSVSAILNIGWMPIDPRMNSYSPYKIALHLYDKYIESSADLCVNISSPNRRSLYRSFKHLSVELHEEDNNIKEAERPIVTVLYKLFDAAYIEIWHLIQTDTFIRFKSTPQFHHLIHVLYPAKAKQALVESRKTLSKSKHKNKIADNVQIQQEHNKFTRMKTETFMHVAVTSVSASPADNIDNPQIEIEEKKTEIKRMRSVSVPAVSLLPIVSDWQMSAKTERYSYNPMIENFDPNDISNEIIVPADIIKTAADFWRNYVHTLPHSEKLEIGVTLYLSMIAADRTIQYIFKKNHAIKQKQIELLSSKFLNMIGWLIQSLWNRNNHELHPTLTKLGGLHKRLKIKMNHFNTMLTMLHETIKFYFPVKYRLQEQYSFDYVFSYSCEIMMNEPLSTKTKSKTYYTSLELKFNSEKKLNESTKPYNAITLESNCSMPVMKNKKRGKIYNRPLLLNDATTSSCNIILQHKTQPLRIQRNSSESLSSDSV